MKVQKLPAHLSIKLWGIYFIVWLFWLAATWSVTDQILASRTNALIKEKKAAINQQSINIADGIAHELDNLHGVPTLVARDGGVISALSRFGTGTHPSTLIVDQRKALWSEDPGLKLVDGYLHLVSTSMGVGVVYIMNAAGDCVAASNAGKGDSFVGVNYAARQYFREAMAGKLAYQYAFGKTSNIPGLFFSAPVTIDGRIVGVVAAKINLPSLLPLISQADAFITDEYGVIILAQDTKLEMRSLPGAAIDGLSREDRISRYKREDFPVLSVNPWPGKSGAELHRFDEENQPLLLTDTLLENDGIKVHVFRRLPEIIEMTRDRLKEFVSIDISGALVLLLVAVTITFLRNRKQNEARLLNILNMSPIAVRISVEKGRRVVFYNPRYAELIKNPAAMGDDPKKYYVRDKDYEEILDELTRGNAIMNRQIELRIPDGSIVWVLASYMPMQYHDEDAVLGWFYDITLLKQTEEALHQARLNAETASAELRELHESNLDDLAVANSVMTHIMRSEGLNDPQIRYFQRPARQFSGDISAAARDGNGDLRVLLADVTGHGLQAALFLLPLSRVFYSMVKRGFVTGEIAKEMNQTMREIAVTGRFIAAAVAQIARDGSSIEMWNGGIPTAIYVQANGDLHKFPSRHLPLGVVNTNSFDKTTETFHTQKGALLLCSDGLTEAENASGEPFGDERCETIVRTSSPEEMFGNIISALESHLGGGVAHDDLSIVLAQCGDTTVTPE